MLTNAAPGPAFTPSRLDRWRIGLFAGLIALNGLQYVLLLAGVPEYFARIAAGTIPTEIVGGQVRFSQALYLAEATARGLSPTSYALYFLSLNLTVAAGFWAAAALVLVKAGGHWFRWMTALFLVFFPSGQLWPIAQISQVNYAVLALFGLLWPLFLVFFFLFPDGRAVPRWSRWPMAVFALIHFSLQALNSAAEWPGSGVHLPPGIQAWFIVIPIGLLFALACQIYRYVRVAGPVERKQVQWFVGGLALFIGGSLTYNLVTGDGELTRADGWFSDVDTLTGLVIPAAITIAILRYRLWDLDIIIRRTLVYGVLSALLALVYFGSVVVLESALRGLIGGGSQVAIVLSTLLIAALFGPLRGRVQAAIDRRFYRRKYDAARTLAAFGASVRDDVDLDALGQRLTAVVDETMQPTNVSLWTPTERRPAQEKPA